jgi:putative ABC transport system permease protein
VRAVVKGARAVWRVLRRSKQLEADMQEEMRFHLQQEADRLAQVDGLSPEEARRQAFVRFGGVEKYKEEGREARGLYWLEGLSLDARLGVRMLVKHRWLTLVGGVAMTVAIAIGATAFEVINDLLDPTLPVPQGDRVVAVKYVAAKTGTVDPHVLHAFSAWRDHLTTLEQIGAFRTAQHNLAAPDRPPEPIKVAEITASAFDVAQTPPLLGRYLLGSDEQAAAAPVVVIGHDAWRLRFNADSHIVGHTIQLGGTLHTVVGVMPAGFAFPIDHQFWIPLRLDPLQYRPWAGPELDVFARLTPGATRAQAEAELVSAGRAAADAYPDGRDAVRPNVLPFTRAHLELSEPSIVRLLRAAQLLVGALVFVVAINLAILLYARTVTRLGEIAVRTALGASRARIVSQLFLEALTLTALGAVAGLACAGVGLQQIEWMARANGGFPFWIRYDLSPASVLYGLALAVIAAVIMGVVPGLKATGRRLSGNLQELNGRTATRLGSWWTTLIVAQVAVASAILPAAAYISWHVVATELKGPAIPVDRFVVADMNLSDEAAAVDRDLVRQRLLALMGKLREQPGVTAVTFSSAVPGFGPDRRIEFQDEARRRDGRTPEVAAFNIDVELLRTYGARLLAGRDFDRRDTAASTAAIVNRTFATEVLGGPPHAALGTRFRYTTRTEWFEIVGVVDDFPGFPRAPAREGSEAEPTIYRPAAPGDVHPAVVSLRFGGPIPAGISERLREIGAAIDPALQMRRVVPLSDFYDELRTVWRMMAWGAGIITLTVLLLSAAGMHALMSFTIAQRTREIGIRSALGAQSRQLLLGIFGRAMRQLSIGLAVGSLISTSALSAAGIGLGRGAALLLIVAAVITIVAAFAALGPARRSLRLPTVAALRVDG